MKTKYMVTGYFNGHQHAKYPVKTIFMILLILGLKEGKDMIIRRETRPVKKLI